MDMFEATTIRGMGTSLARRLGEEVGLAFSLLTRLPVPRFAIRSRATLASAFWAYPLVGAVVGAIGAFAYWVAGLLELGMFISTFAALLAMVLATGAFHEDGLADFCDGVGGGTTREAKLEIMRDSRIGTYGTMALLFLVVLSAALLVELSIAPWQPVIGGFSAIFIMVAALQRSAIGIVLAALPPARSEGYAVAAGAPNTGSLVAGLALPAFAAVIVLGPTAAFAAITGAVVGASGVAFVANRYLRGYTGDVLGAAASVSWLTTLAALLMFTKTIPLE